MANRSETYKIIFSGAILIRVDNGENQEYGAGDYFRRNLVEMPTPATKINCSKISNNFCRNARGRQLISSYAEFEVKEVNYI